MSDRITLSGTVADVFAHRFTLEAGGSRILADLGPKGAERVALLPGDVVTIAGERKPSEMKVFSVTRAGETTEIPHGAKPPKPQGARPHGTEPRGADPAPKAA